MKKTTRKLTLSKESIRTLTSLAHLAGAGTQASIRGGCTTENTWYCPTHSACSACPLCA
jgi:hypothetical protein